MGDSKRISYQDIKTEVLLSIKDNTWPPGTIMPGEVELAEKFGCARATVNRAMRELAEEGVIERKRKAGTLVKLSPTARAKFDIPVIREEIELTGGVYRYALVERTQEVAPNWLRVRLALLPDDEVLHLICMHYRDNKPYQFEDRWINLAAVPNAAETKFETVGPNEWLLREMSYTHAEISFSATRATAEVAEFLECADGDPLFASERVTRFEGKTITFARMVFASGYRLTTQI